jgi:hypothetical protein
MRFSFTIYHLSCIIFFSCQNQVENQNTNSLETKKIETLKSENKKNRFQYPKKDSLGMVFYLGKYYLKNQLDSIKNQELNTWKKDLEKKYKLDFNTKHFNKYFNIVYRSTPTQANVLEYITNVFFRDIYQKYFNLEPDFPFQIVYFANKKEFEENTLSSAYGFYRSSEKTLYTYTGSGEGTLWHELVHAFVDCNINHEIQQWFSEGFASFYEMAGISNNQFVEGYTNWRLPLLQKMLKKEGNLSLKKFLEEETMSENNAYAKARFLFCYLWVYDKIIPFSKIYLYELSPKYKGKLLAQKSIETMEKLVGKSWKEIEKEYNEMAFKYKEYEKMIKK